MNEIKLTKPNGTTIDAELVCILENSTNGKRYIYYTLNEIVGTEPNSTIKIYVGKLKQNDQTLDLPISDEEWTQLKGFMGEVLKDTANPNIKYISENEIADKTVVSEKVIAMPTTYDYVKKHNTVYNANIPATSTPNVEPTPVPMATVEAPAPTPVSTETIAEPISVTPDPAPSVEPITPTVDPFATPTPETPTEVTPSIATPSNPIKEIVPSLEPEQALNTGSPSGMSKSKIDVESIKAKYAEMRKQLEELERAEIEASERYNATLELSELHNEQHANYVANEQSKETPEIVPPLDNIATDNVVTPTPVEPVAVTKEPAPAVDQAQDIETNWFDLPIQ